jgi:hypothetical protein
MRIFGFNLSNTKEPTNDSFAPPQAEGEIQIDTRGLGYGGYYNNIVSVDDNISNENELIKKYRLMALVSEVEEAIEDVIDEAIVSEDNEVHINLDKVEGISDNVKKIILEEHTGVLKLLNWNSKGYDIFKKFYIDGRLYFHKILDTKNPKNGLVEVRPIDALTIKKIVEIDKQMDPGTGVEISKIGREYYSFTPNGLSNVMISKDSVTYINSGIFNEDRSIALSFLHRIIKPLNQLKMMEDSAVIYRLTRSPERRVFYLDVGNLPKQAAEKYVKDTMARFKNKIGYNTKTGEVNDSSKTMAITEDFWLARKEGGRGTEITTIPGGATLGQIEDIQYFLTKFLDSLKIPKSRRDETAKFALGRSSEITRDEIKFGKFIKRLRKKFSEVFLDILHTQLITKKIITEDEWNKIKNDIIFVFPEDSHFTELKEIEVFQERCNLADRLNAYVGKYYSNDYIRRNIFKQTNDDIKMEDKKIASEKPEETSDVNGTGYQDNSEEE